MNADLIRAFLTDLHQTWPEGDLQRLAGFYHPDVVLLPPDLGVPIRGRDAVVASYREFLSAAALISFDITGLDVFDFSQQTATDDGPTGTWMAHLNFDILYELGGERYEEKGLELYTVIEQTDGPAIAWRAQTVLDSRLAEKSDPAG